MTAAATWTAPSDGACCGDSTVAACATRLARPSSCATRTVDGTWVEGTWVEGTCVEGTCVDGTTVDGIIVDAIAVDGIAVEGMTVGAIADEGTTSVGGTTVDGTSCDPANRSSRIVCAKSGTSEIGSVASI